MRESTKTFRPFGSTRFISGFNTVVRLDLSQLLPEQRRHRHALAEAGEVELFVRRVLVVIGQREAEIIHRLDHALNLRLERLEFDVEGLGKLGGGRGRRAEQGGQQTGGKAGTGVHKRSGLRLRKS
jgi:hypothetical protein